jgi:Ca-activated chloride channel family protein
MSNLINFAARLDRKNLDNSRDYEGHLMISLKAEESEDRTPLCLSLVLDVSGSMSGPTQYGKSKLDCVKDTAKRIVQNLSASDFLSIVTYSNTAQVVLPRKRVSNKEEFFAAIDGLRTMDCTNLSAGLLAGAAEMDKDFDGVKRVLLLSDGLPNQGVSDRDGLASLVKTKSPLCSVSAFAFGTDADQELMGDISKAGAGNFYFIQGADIQNIFARELGGLLSCLAQNMTITFAPSDGNKVLGLLNQFVSEEKDGKLVVRVNDMYAGEIRHLILKVALRPQAGQKSAGAGLVHISYDDAKTGKREAVELSPTVRFVDGASADQEADLEVAEQAAVLEAFKAQQEAVEKANRQEFEAAKKILENAKAVLILVAGKGSALCAEVLGVHEAIMKHMTEDSYNVNIGTSVSNVAYGASRNRAAGDTLGISGQSLSSIYRTKRQKKTESDFNAK